MSLFSRGYYGWSLTLVLAGAAAALAPSLASASWSNQPAWAAGGSDSGGSAPRRSIAREGRSNYDIAPFTPGSNNLALDVGQVFLMGDLSSSYSDSIGTQLHYTYGVSDMFGFDTSLGYSDHSDGKFSMTSFKAGVRTNLSWYDKVVPYVVFGLGFYKPSYQLSPVTSISPMLFGLHLGPGVHLELTKNLFFGANITFHDIFGTTKVTPQGPLEVGGTFTSFFLSAGVSF